MKFIHCPILIAVILLFCVKTAYSQHQDLQEKPKIWHSENKMVPDSMTLLNAFRQGKIHGHFRYFFSATDNSGHLSDYYANAVGGGIRYQTEDFHGFALGVSGFYIFNAGSSDLFEKDLTTGQTNRYEIGLFDLDNTTSIEEINRVEEFFIQFQRKGSKVVFGRQLLNTPFFNLQDGRMRPTAVEGIWIEHNINKKLALQGGWIYGVAPRGTSKWYSLEEGIGVYPKGVDGTGVKSNYYNNVQTLGAFLLHFHALPNPALQIQLWNMYLDNISQTTLIQLEVEKPLTNGKIYFGSQNAVQIKVGNGGNEDPLLRYNSNQKNVWIWGARTGWKNTKWDHSINFNRISNGGRYLMPREFGRDYFYTFMPRERNEGFGDVTAIVWKSIFKPNANISFQPSLGYFSLPNVKDYYLNKYGLPSYTQLYVDIRYKFGRWLQGLEAQLLYVHKWKSGDTYNNDKFVIHKVDMDLLNIVLNFRF